MSDAETRVIDAANATDEVYSSIGRALIVLSNLSSNSKGVFDRPDQVRQNIVDAMAILDAARVTMDLTQWPTLSDFGQVEWRRP